MCLCLAFMKWTLASSQLGLMENVSLNGFNNNNSTTNINTIRQDLMSMDNNSHIMGDRSNSVWLAADVVIVRFVGGCRLRSHHNQRPYTFHIKLVETGGRCVSMRGSMPQLQFPIH